MEVRPVSTSTLTDSQPDNTWDTKTQSGQELSSPVACCCGCLKRTSDIIINSISRFFYRLGLFIGLYPWYVILGGVVFLGIFVPGIPLFFHQETDGQKLWVPSGSQALLDKEWVDSHFPAGVRPAAAIVVSDNVLTPKTLNALMDLHIKVTSPEQPRKWEDACARRGSACWTSSLLELWSYDETIIRSLDEKQILEQVNSITTSPVFLTPIHIEKYLGVIERSTDGKIISAKATSMTFYVKANSTIQRKQDTGAIQWEEQFDASLVDGHGDLENVFHYTIAGATTESSDFIFGDVGLLSAGYIIIFLFVTVVLGRFNCVQQRIYITVAGVLCVGMSIGVSYGLCSYLGYAYSPLNSILPFLLIGIGVDDMFVILQAFDQVSEDEKDAERPLHEKIALCLQHAGVSITVTSATDVVAFGMGATTVLPGLRSFCVYASFGILSIFLLQATFFVACVTIDERRALVRRNACCCCYSHPEDWLPNKCSRVLLLQTVFDKFYGPWLVKLPVKIAVTVCTVVLFCVCIWGLSNVKQDSNPTWFLPPEGRSFSYLTAKDTYFPGDGRYTTAVYLGEFNHFRMFTQLDSLHAAIVDDPYTDIATVSNWFHSFKQWLSTSTDISVTSRLSQDRSPLSETDMIILLKQFMFEPPRTGQRFASAIKFDATETKIMASQIHLTHINMEFSTERVAAMDSLRGVCAQASFRQEDCFAYSRFYSVFEGDKAIQMELFRNIGLAFVCVFVMMLILLADLWACIFVSVAVLMALVDVAGALHLWGLTINTVTAIQLIIAVGLIVDYSAHIGHCFMVKKGTRNERTVRTLGYMGPAVMFGGFSTFLAFVILAGSQSYIFQAFFKVLLSVVLFGLFHGLVFLPVLLSWVGPAPYFTDDYPPSIIDKTINRIKSCSCTENIPDLRFKHRLEKARTAVVGFRFSQFRQRFKFNSWINGAFSKGKPSPSAGTNFVAPNGMIASSSLPNGRLSQELPVETGATPHLNSQIDSLHGSNQTPSNIINLTMADFLNVQFKMTGDSEADRPLELGPTWEHTIQRIPNRVVHQTAWQPSYKTTSGSDYYTISSAAS